MPNTAIDLQGRPAISPRARLQTDPVTGEPVLLYPEGLLQLNATAHEVVSRCDGKTTVENIVAALAGEYEVSAEELRADVLSCLADLQHRQCLVFPA